MSKPNIDQLIINAKQAIDKRQLVDAKNVLGQLFQLTKSDLRVFLLAGKYHLFMNELERAKSAYLTVLKSDSSNIGALHAVGYIFYIQLEFKMAIKFFKRVLKINPKQNTTSFFLACCMQDMGEKKKAITLYKSVIASNPKIVQAELRMFQAKAEICDWSNRDVDRNRIVEIINGLTSAEMSFQIPMYTLNYYDLEDELHLKAANLNVEYLKQNSESIKIERETVDKKGKIRVAYISPDFREHAVGLLIHQIFEKHDRLKFEIFAYSLANSKDKYQEHIINGVDIFKDVSQFGNSALIQEIINDNIDVLVDLAGYSKFTRPEIFTQRLAKAQVQYLGYSDTMGAGLHDYIIADKILITEQEQKNYGEKVMYIDHNFCASDLDVDFDYSAPFLEHLLKETFIFTCFNGAYKIEQKVLKAWAEILQKCENSVMLFAKTNEIAAENIIKAFLELGVQENRIIFSTRLPMDQYLGVLNRADLFLDTWVYTAGSTGVCSALAALPLLTLKGKNNASKMGTSINDSVNMIELICDTKEEYVNKAISLYNDRTKLKLIKQKLGVEKNKSRAFNQQVFANSLEKVFVKMLDDNS